MTLKQLAEKTIKGATNTIDTHYSNAKTADIQAVVAYAVERAAPYTVGFSDEIAARFRTPYRIANAIWSLLHDELTYKADGRKQNIKSPAQLIKDGIGDCKSFAVFTSSVLQNLRIPHYLRYAGYEQGVDVTHVYVVIEPNTSRQIIIDAVHDRLNEEVKYTYKQDRQVTKSGRIGNVQPPKQPSRPYRTHIVALILFALATWQLK